MRDKIKMGIRIAGWLFSLTIIGAMTAGMAFNLNPWDSGIGLFFMPFLAAIVTMFFWGNLRFSLGVGMGQAAQPQQESRRQKQKHRSMERLVDELDDDSLVELETLLMSRQDEQFQ